jgi:hypothetical protein
MKGAEPIYGLQPGEITWLDVCAQLRIARPTLYEAVKLLQVPVVRRGRVVRFRQDLLDRLLAGQAPAARNEAGESVDNLPILSDWSRDDSVPETSDHQAWHSSSQPEQSASVRIRSLGRNIRSRYARRIGHSVVIP